MIIRRMPLYWRLSDTPQASAPGIPSYADFEIVMDMDGLVRQKLPHNMRGVLDAIYASPRSAYSATASNREHTEYYRPFFHYIVDRWKETGRPAPACALDMGCGDGFLVSWLKHRLKADHAYGVEIAPQPKAWPGAEIDPAPREDHEVDLLVHHHVLEHVLDPVKWLIGLTEYMAADGLMILAVPDCTDAIALGDIGMCAHQHITYFDIDSLKLTLFRAGLRPLFVDQVGGSLYAVAGRMPAPTTVLAAGGWKFEPAKFEDNMRSAVAKVRARIRAASGEVGFYVPLRALPYLAALGSTFNGSIRLYDDGLAGRCLDGVPSRIGNIEDLVDDPVNTMIIMSLTNGEAIAERISRFADLEGMTVWTLRDILTL